VGDWCCRWALIITNCIIVILNVITVVLKSRWITGLGTSMMVPRNHTSNFLTGDVKKPMPELTVQDLLELVVFAK
jgi:hypothetical protein